MLGALTSFLVMAVAGRELSDVMNTFEILFFRSFIGLVIILALIGKFGWHSVYSARPKFQIIRNLIHFGGQFGWFLGISLLPLATVFAIEFTVDAGGPPSFHCPDRIASQPFFISWHSSVGNQRSG